MKPGKAFWIRKLWRTGQEGQTVMEALLLMCFLFITASLVSAQLGPHLETSVLIPIRDTISDTIKFGTSDGSNGPVDETQPDLDLRNPFAGRRNVPSSL